MKLMIQMRITLILGLTMLWSLISLPFILGIKDFSFSGYLGYLFSPIMIVPWFISVGSIYWIYLTMGVEFEEIGK